MNASGLDIAGERSRVEAFQRKHRIALLTLLFTDIVGSTRLKQVLGERAAIEVLTRHDAIIRETLAQFEEAEEIRTTGDSFFCIFAKPSDATHFALLAQYRLRRLARETGHAVFDRIGIHVGEVFIQQRGEAERDFFGLQIDTAARIQSLAGADQILLSRFAFDNARQVLRGQEIAGVGELSWLNHGCYEMKGVEDPVEVCEVGEIGAAALAGPEDTEKAHRLHSANAETVLGWRPAAGQYVQDSPWLLERALGDGGFGEVWLAHHEKLQIRRVIKFCFRGERVRSLRREVTLFRVLRERVGEHPGIVVVHDVVFDTPPFYLVMDFVDGPNLAEWATGETPLKDIPLATRIAIVVQIADALHAAHEAGVIHRDVKPTNILLADERGVPRVKLTDFGIGQVTSSAVLDGVSRDGFTQTLLSTGTGSGTPLYMAPELLAGRPATPRSDLYSLGVVFYQMLIGDCTVPLTADWPEQIDDPLLRADLRRCVAGAPEKRFATVAEFSQQLKTLEERRTEILRAEAAAALAQRRIATKKRRLLVGFFFLLAVALGCLVSWITSERELLVFVAFMSPMWFGCANILFDVPPAEPEPGRHHTLRAELLNFLRIFGLVGAQTLVVYFVILLCEGSLDGSLISQIIGLLGMAWSTVGMALAAQAVFRSQGALILAFSVLFLPQIFFSGEIVKPTVMSGAVRAVGVCTPGYATHVLMDMSFIYNRPLIGEINEDHYQAIKNLGANEADNRTSDDRFVRLRPALFPVAVLLFWGVAGLFTAIMVRRWTRRTMPSP